MKIKVNAPFRIHLNTRNDARLGQSDHYRDLWKALESRTDQMESLQKGLVRNPEFLHKSYRKQTELQYTKVDENPHYNSPELIRVHPTDKTLSSIPNNIFKTGRDILGLESSSSEFLAGVRFRLFDRTIGICEGTLDFSPDKRQLGDLAEIYFENLQDWFSKFYDRFVKSAYQSSLVPFLEDVHSVPESGEILQGMESYRAYPDLGPPELINDRSDPGGNVLWANRTLIEPEPGEALETRLKETWMHGSKVNEFSEINLGWGHNLVVKKPGEEFENAWEGLVLAQYYYSAMHTIDLNLTNITGNSLANLKFGETKKKLNQLDSIITSHQLLLMDYEDTSRTLVGEKFQYMKHLRSLWNFKELIGNMKSKIQICQERLDKKHQDKVETSQSIMEVLLYVLGAIGLVDVLMGVSNYGLYLYGSRYYSKLDIPNIPGLLDLARIYPPDLFLWFGAGLLVVTTTIFAWFQLRY